MPMWALLLSGIKKQKPAANKVQAICGKVKSSSARRPQVSMVQTAGQAKTKLTAPKPQEARSASRLVAPALTKTVEE